MSNCQLKSSGAQKGFTLIEMSIVLVIIGLIIGGILKGQEIIDASRQKNFISQVDALRSAVNTFADKYNGIPGDYDRAIARINAQTANGTGDGIVGTANTTMANMLAQVGVGATAAAGTATAAGEPQLFFCHLAQAGLIGGASGDCATAASFFGSGSPLPALPYSQSGMTVAYGLAETADGNNDRVALWGRVHRGAAAAVAAGTSGVLSGRTMAQIDFKYDDGLPGLGNIRSAFAGTSAQCPIATAASAYVATGEVPDCVALIELVQ